MTRFLDIKLLLNYKYINSIIIFKDFGQVGLFDKIMHFGTDYGFKVRQFVKYVRKYANS